MIDWSDEPPGPLPAPPIFVACVGRKGLGKSELAYVLWDSWDGDRVVLDTTGSVGAKHPEEETERLEVPPPTKFPEHLREDGKRLSLRYVPDHSAPDWRDDMDRVVGMCFAKGDCLLWIEEAGLLAPANQVPPHTRAANHMGRHQALSIILTMPRPMDVDPLFLGQADAIFAFNCPNPNDRKRLAEVTGFDRQLIDELMAGLDKHAYIRFLTSEHEIAVFPPIPIKRTRVIEKYIDDTPGGASPLDSEIQPSHP